MAVIKIDNFGGEIPRTTERSLPLGAASANYNLLATSDDFRPVKGSKDTGSTAWTGAYAESHPGKTLYRSKSREGIPNSSINYGWLVSDVEVNYVPSQLNEDTKNLTYATYGSAAPELFWEEKVNNVWTTKTLPLGVTPPPKPEIAVLKFDAFTTAEATEWVKSTLVPTVSTMVAELLPDFTIKDNQFKCRFTDNSGNLMRENVSSTHIGETQGRSVAGITTVFNGTHNFEFFPTGYGSEYLSQRSVFEPWNLMFRIPDFNVCSEGLGNQQLGGVYVPSAWEKPTYIGFPAFPYWGVPSQSGLKTKLLSIKLPHGASMLTDTQANTLANEIVALFSPEAPEVMQKRYLLDAAKVAFAKAGEYSKDNLPKLTDTPEQASSKVALQAAAVARMLDAQKKAAVISAEIEAIYVKMANDVTSLMTTFFKSKRLDRTIDFPNGLVNIDDDPKHETRFYFLTYTNILGQESAPGPLSDQLDLTTGDLVVINQPTSIGDDASITAYNIYRSNAGTTASGFQLVEVVTKGATVPVPYSGWGSTDIPVEGYGDEKKWRDIIANWVVYYNTKDTPNDRGVIVASQQSSVSLFASTSGLRIGDTVEQRGTNYSITMRWNGAAWTMQQVPNISTVQNTTAYLDGKPASQLSEICPTVTWAVPPKVAIPNTNPVQYQHLKGLTAMPNGVMAGYIDNVVYFCEPYTGYAWPVEYAIPVGFPIVGLCCFGQTLVVGTKGNPSFISGADSMSMSEQRLDSNQACVSARSMVAAMGGVLYASPDGYCFASQSGVEVLTVGLFSNEDWQALNPSSIFATVHDSVLYFWYEVDANNKGCFGLDFVAKKLTRHEIPATAVFDDVMTDSAYVVNGTKIEQLFSGNRKKGLWMSGVITLPAPAPLAWVKVIGDNIYNGSAVSVSWSGDGKYRTKDGGVVITSAAPVRLPPGRYIEHRIQVTSYGRVTSVLLASTTEELKAT